MTKGRLHVSVGDSFSFLSLKTTIARRDNTHIASCAALSP